jgi:hypothetical protein
MVAKRGWKQEGVGQSDDEGKERKHLPAERVFKRISPIEAIVNVC